MTRYRLAAEYADKHLRSEVAAREGYVDELVFLPTRETGLAWALSGWARGSRGGRDGESGGDAVSGELLLTGATGFVGMEVLGRYLEHSDRRIIVPVRAVDDVAAVERVWTRC